ncbi:MAG: phage major capsid protein, partial [Geminicoccaceae bacterium]
SLVRVRSTGSKSIMLPKRTGQFAARRVGEQETRSETTGLTWGMIEIVAPEMCALIDISRQNLEDSAFDLEAELRLEADEQFAVKEGAEVVSGTGVNQCEGFLTNNDVGTTVSGSAASVADADGQADGILTLKHSIKTAYTRNASWALNRTTLGSVRKLKDGNKQYIWMPGLALGKPNTIDGDPYVEVPDMPSEGANTYPIAYGDFARAYTLVDRLAMSLQRDNLTQATSGNVRFLFWKRVGGAVTLAEAIRKLKCSA